MKKKLGWIISISICLAVLTTMIGVGFLLLADESEIATADSKVEAVLYEQGNRVDFISKTPGNDLAEETDSDTGIPVAGVNTEFNDSRTEPIVISETTAPHETENTKDNNALPVEQKASEKPVIKIASSAPVDYRTIDDSAQTNTENRPGETQNEQPAASPVVVELAAEIGEQAQPVAAVPVTYSWGTASNYVFRIQVKVTNNGSEQSRSVIVSVPLLENSSPYQSTTFKSANYTVVSTSGRISTFDLGELAPGETKTIIADFDISVIPISINSTNETIEKARIAYEQYAVSGNCRTLALGFINRCREMGITAREVIGFARTQRGPMTSGSLQGARHSWAEVYVDGLGWVPVDLTFQYFGAFPHSSHIVESYSDQSIKVNYAGGNLSASWSNIIL